jgi:hypothetical protein
VEAFPARAGHEANSAGESLMAIHPLYFLRPCCGHWGSSSSAPHKVSSAFYPKKSEKVIGENIAS